MFAFQSEKYRRKAAKAIEVCMQLHVDSHFSMLGMGRRWSCWELNFMWKSNCLSFYLALVTADLEATVLMCMKVWSLEFATRCYKQTFWGRKNLGSTDFLPARKTWASMQMASFKLAFGVYVGIPTTSAKWPCGGSLVRMPNKNNQPKLKIRGKPCIYIIPSCIAIVVEKYRRRSILLCIDCEICSPAVLKIKLCLLCTGRRCSWDFSWGVLSFQHHSDWILFQLDDLGCHFPHGSLSAPWSITGYHWSIVFQQVSGIRQLSVPQLEMIQIWSHFLYYPDWIQFIHV